MSETHIIQIKSANWKIIFVPVVFLILFVAAVGLGTMLAALTVSYRDFRFVTPFLIQVGMYATPTIYMLLPEQPSNSLRVWMAINPLVAPIASFRACLLGGEIPWLELAISAIAAFALFVAGCLYFRKVEDDFADKI